MTNASPLQEFAPPLIGCLYCHAEGTITEVEPRKVFGLGHEFPSIICSNCGSTAFFDQDQQNGMWRLRYRKFNRDDLYYFAALRLGKANWLKKDEALKLSTAVYIQRQRVRQAKSGDLSWLRPERLSPPPSLMSPNELIYLSSRKVDLRQMGQTGNQASQKTEKGVLDTGQFYVTDVKLHLLGRSRDWSYDLSQIRKADFTDKAWKVYLDTKDTVQYFQGEFDTNETDPQLTTVVINALRHLVAAE